jgi:excisionase family DNA binding protein
MVIEILATLDQDWDEPETLVDVNEAARILQVHPMSIYRYAKERKIPYFQVGGRKRFNIDLVIKRLTEITEEKIDANRS